MSPDRTPSPGPRNDAGSDRALATTLAQQQAVFAAHLRDPQRHAAPPVAEERIALYRELFFNNVRTLLAGNFPMLHRLLGADRWEQLVRRFYREHPSRTPLFPELGREFLDWLERWQTPARPQLRDADAISAPDDDWPAFMLELAHYEWIELALELDESDPSRLEFDAQGDPLHGTPLVSPLAWPLAYRFPVHRIGPDFQPHSPPDAPTFLLIRRDAQFVIHFHEIDALGHSLLLALHDNPDAVSGLGLIEQLIQGQPDAEALRQLARERLTAMHRRGVILGTRPLS